MEMYAAFLVDYSFETVQIGPSIRLVGAVVSAGIPQRFRTFTVHGQIFGRNIHSYIFIECYRRIQPTESHL